MCDGILREKAFRVWLKGVSLVSYEGRYVAVYCSLDALVPDWAYMLCVSHFGGVVQGIYMGMPDWVDYLRFLESLQGHDWSQYKGKRVMLEGCADLPYRSGIYTRLASMLLPYVKTLMYGEPCSAVPIFKQKRFCRALK